MKILIEEKDETQQYRPTPIQQVLQMVKCFDDKVVVYVPNLCGGQSKITIYYSENPKGNEENMEILNREDFT